MSITTGDAFLLLEVLGTVAFAVSGGAVAVRAGMDWLGVVVLAVIAAIGGGTLRDLLTGTLPVSWVIAPWPVLVAILTGLTVIVIGHRVPRVSLDSWTAVLVADAAGLAAFTVTGAVTTLSEGATNAVAVILAVVTGTGGGVLRDVLARERPRSWSARSTPSPPSLGHASWSCCTNIGAADPVVRWSAVAVILALRLAAVRWRWSLPRFAGDEH